MSPVPWLSFSSLSWSRSYAASLCVANASPVNQGWQIDEIKKDYDRQEKLSLRKSEIALWKVLEITQITSTEIYCWKWWKQALQLGPISLCLVGLDSAVLKKKKNCVSMSYVNFSALIPGYSRMQQLWLWVTSPLPTQLQVRQIAANNYLLMMKRA